MNRSRSHRPSWHPRLLFAVALFNGSLLQWVQCQSCGPKVSPRLLREIPCDMNAFSYCTQPGSAYPWSAVRRYIFENQGFMTRMYGENRQSQVIREEISRVNDKYQMVDIASYRNAKSDPRLMVANVKELSVSNSKKDIELNQTNSVLLNETIGENNGNNTNRDIENATTGEEVESDVDLYTTTVGDNLVNSVFSSPNSNFDVAEERDSATTPPADIDNAVPDEKPEKPSKGYNACPITQEVVAPYWANNTNGQTLALLNVYPFEQYIHWEKCAFEGEQMNCREGCRCEQQYRLHRLLAFDPKNECRGIFADWFRFPGCCVCICYDNHERINNRKARL